MELEYPDGALVRTGQLSVSVAEEKISLEEVATGRFHGRLPLTGFSEGKFIALIEGGDAYGNSISQEYPFEISGETLLAGLQERAPIILALAAAALLLVFYARHFLSYKHRLAALKKKEKSILALEKDLHKRYFKETSISKKDFKESSKEIERQLAEVREKIRGLKK